MDNKANKPLHLKNGMEFQVVDSPRRSTYFLAFDMLLVFTFGAGWALSFTFAYDMLLDNPLIRVAGFNPITVGINHFPARIVSNIAWGVMLFPLTMYMIANLFHFQFCGLSRGVRNLMIVLQLIAYFAIMAFGLLLGFEPKFNAPKFSNLALKDLPSNAEFQQDVFDIKVHLWGFILFLAGLSVTRILEIFCFVWDPENKGIKWPKGGNIYLGLQIFYVILCVGATYVPIWMIFRCESHLIESLPQSPHVTVLRWFRFEAQVSYAWRILMILVPIVTWYMAPEQRGPSFCVTNIDKDRKMGKAEKYYP